MSSPERPLQVELINLPDAGLVTKVSDGVSALYGPPSLVDAPPGQIKALFLLGVTGCVGADTDDGSAS